MRPRRPANCLHLLSCWTCPWGRRQARLQGGYLAQAHLQGGYPAQARLQGGYLAQARLQGGYLAQARRGPEPVARVAALAGPLVDCPLGGPAEGAQSLLDGIR